MIVRQYNYIKKYGNNKRELFNHLLKVMPKETLYAYSKKELKFKKIGITKEVIKKANFLFYNQNLVTELIFDIDEKYDLETIFQKFLNRTGITPTWICSTARGVQLCVSLNTFYKLSSKQLKVLKDFKKFIAENWEIIDKAGSNRLSGWWRNPATQKDFIFTGWITTFEEIKDFLIRNKRTIKQQFKTATIKNSIKANIRAIKEKKFFLAGAPVKGNRNKWLWYNTMLYCNSKNFEEVLEVVKELHQYVQEPLTEEELIKIAKSVLAYNTEAPYKIKNKNKEELRGNWIYGWKQKSHWNIGSMGFEKISDLPYQEYLKEVKRRQSMAGKEKGKNNIINYVKPKAEATKQKVYEAIEQLKNQGEKVTILKVKELAKVSYASAQKYVKQARNEGLI